MSSTVPAGVMESVEDASMVHMTAIEALVELLRTQALVDRRRGIETAGFVTGYPGSPLGGVQSEMERRADNLAELGITQSPGLNEELAATALWGTQTVSTQSDATVDGVFGMWYGKAPGVDRAADALRHGNIRGAAAKGGVLVVAGDDPNANATVFPTDSTGAFHAWGMPVLFPSNVQEIIDLGLHGYAISRLCSLWVGLKTTTAVADGSGFARPDTEGFCPELPTVQMDGVTFRPQLRASEAGAGMRAAERDLYEGRLKLAAAYVRANRLNPVTLDPPHARVGVVAVGKAWSDLTEALRRMGLDDGVLHEWGVRLKKVSALFPVEDAEWREFAQGLDEIVVIEEKRPFVERFLRDALYGQPTAPCIVGKWDQGGRFLLPQSGELTPLDVIRALNARLGTRWDLPASARAAAEVDRPRPLLPLATARTPFFCSGCPHNTSLVAPEGAKVGAGIGCHLMNVMVPRPEYGESTGYTQMGGEGAQWVGMAPYVETDHIFQNVGDGTFHHSASLALRMAVAGGVNMTYKLLYNNAVGMTGGQQVRGAMPVPELTQLLLAEGVKRIIITTDDPRKYRRTRLRGPIQVWHRDRIVEAQETLAAVPGITVLIHDQHCAAERRRLIKRKQLPQPTKRIMVNERVCEGCGDCNQKSQCLSVQPVETEFGRKTAIHQSSCNFDYTCVKGDCPSFLTVDVAKAKKTKRAVPKAPASPAPKHLMDADRFNVHMTGIGGTGVVSVNETLAIAAKEDGKLARSFDLPGASIKAGTVVSQLQVYTDAEPAPSIDPGQADTFLAFDLLGAMRADNLRPLSASRTVAIGSSSAIPTGQMAVDSSIPYRDTLALQREVDAVTRAEHNVYVDVESLAKAIFGSHMAANFMLVGVAHQQGALPLSAEAIERAIERNGVAVDQNIEAFRWGRAVVAHPDRVAAITAVDRPTGLGSLDDRLKSLVEPFAGTGELQQLVSRRVRELEDFQSLGVARRYAEAVADVHRAEEPDAGHAVALAVARSLYQLMAYKDEYEVARLHLLDASRVAVENEFGEGARVSWNLHPPVLRYLGIDRKLTLGPWFRPVFVALRSMRRVRGTVLDPFGPTKVRRVERALVAHYLDLLESTRPLISQPDLRGPLLELLDATEGIRGYEDIKLRRVSEYLDKVEPSALELGVDPGTARLRSLLGDGADR